MIRFAEEALADLERIFDFNFERDPATRAVVLRLDEHAETGRRVLAIRHQREAGYRGT